MKEKNDELRKKHRLSFPVLSDLENAYAKKLSLVFSLPEDLRTVYRSFDIDLPTFNGDNSWELPIPARIVVDQKGNIQSIEADPDYTKRPEPDETIAILERLV